MRAFVIQSSLEVVIEFDAFPSRPLISRAVRRPDLELHARKNLVNRLTYCAGCEVDIWSLKRLAVERLCHVILDDESAVLTEVGFYLIGIEKRLASKHVPRQDVDEWRVKLGQWRAHLHTINGWCTRYVHNIKVLRINDEDNARAGQLSLEQEQIQQRLESVILDADKFQATSSIFG